MDEWVQERLGPLMGLYREVGALVIVACAVSWLTPSVAWPQVAAEVVYLRSLESNQFPSIKQIDCAATDFACMGQGRTGPVPDLVKVSYAEKLRSQGWTVVMEKPTQGVFAEVSVVLSVEELPLRSPIVSKRFVCQLDGMIARYGAKGKTKQSKEVQEHNIEIHPLSDKANHLVLACLKPAASVVKKGIHTMS